MQKMLPDCKIIPSKMRKILRWNRPRDGQNLDEDDLIQPSLAIKMDVNWFWIAGIKLQYILFQ